MKFLKNLDALDKSTLILAGMLLLCLAELPYGYYTVVRLATSIVAGCWAYQFFERKNTALGIIACGVLLLVQPIFKIAMDRDTWSVIDVIVAILSVWLVLQRDKIIK
ncbi:MAG: hypothetical protein NC111_05005 [Bacteroides sp.]|nr:hypothetical protein [Bacteroides sp.]MCM1413686.1 hypothetical protein [Bacteroides sp.]MCM1471865.1 hypothetical protein [Bacteroides sp.]